MTDAHEPSTSTDATSEPPKAPESVQKMELLGKEIFLLGTAHVSKESVVEVRRAIEAIQPDTVCVELDQGRYENLTNLSRWKKTDIVQVIREGKALLLLSSLVMTSFQRRIGEKLGVLPGAELIEAVHASREHGAEVILADRDIQITLKRAWSRFGLWERAKVSMQLVASLFLTEEIDEVAIEELKKEEKLGDLLQLLAEEFPSMKTTLIDERDRYLAEKIRTAEGSRILAVVGAGHVPGIKEQIATPQDLSRLNQVPSSGWAGPILKWAIPLVIIGILIYGFVSGSAEESLGSVYIWFLINGVLSALGAALALGHPLTIASAFLAAPLTSLNPMIAAGWVSGLVQALVKKPTVEDLEELPTSITTVKGFWRNPVSRILLVVVFSNLGSVLGTFVAGSWIAARVFG